MSGAHDASLLSYGYFANGQPRAHGAFTEQRRSLLSALARGTTEVDEAIGTSGLRPEEAGDTLAALLEEGLVDRRGSHLALTFPVLGGQDAEAVAPAADEAAVYLIGSGALPDHESVAARLGGMGYGHLSEQFPVWTPWLESFIVGEGLRCLMERGVLPRPPDPAPARFGMVGWFGKPRLMSWEPDK